MPHRVGRARPEWVFLAVTAICFLGGTITTASAGDIPPGEVPTTCVDVLEGRPGNELRKATDPADGSKVGAGQVVEVRMTWKAEDFTEAPLHALDCVTVDDHLEVGLSFEERRAPNDGEFTHRFTVPGSLPAGTRICDRGAVAGDGNGYFERNKSNDVCFTVVEENRPTPPVTAPPLPAVIQPPPPPPPPVAAAAPPPAQAPQTREAAEVAPRQQLAPAPVRAPGPAKPAPVRAPAPAKPVRPLPETGSDNRIPILLGGLCLALGGAVIIKTTPGR